MIQILPDFLAVSLLEKLRETISGLTMSFGNQANGYSITKDNCPFISIKIRDSYDGEKRVYVNEATITVYDTASDHINKIYKTVDLLDVQFKSQVSFKLLYRSKPS